MKNLKFVVVLTGILVGVILSVPDMLSAQEGGAQYQIPEGVYIKLTKDFYEALQQTGSGAAKVYTSDPSDEYLKQIAVATKFMVETNLEILKQQARMNEMLRVLLKDKHK